jgi:DNA-binding response OmpR family regulator
MRILIAEDEQHLANGLRFNLEAEGYDVMTVGDGLLALSACEEATFDLLVLDVMMPGATGFEVLRSLRERNDYTPVLILTALGKPEHVLEGFESGADDYLPKPFDLSIFLARIKSLLRRRMWAAGAPPTEKPGEGSDEALTIINERVIDLPNHELRYREEIIRLTLMEAKLFEFLISNKGTIISRKTLLEEVWGLHQDTDTRAVDNFIVRLRKYLGDDDADNKILESIRGVGYRLNLL